MSRAVILPTPADPLLLHYWLTLFWNVWSDEVDRLYIYANGHAEPEVLDFIEWLGSDEYGKCRMIYNPQQVEHGEAIRLALQEVKESHVMLIEDDFFIFKSGYVDMLYTFVEKGKANLVGSRRMSCGVELYEQAARRWGLSYEGLGDVGCCFWPSFIFLETDLLRKVAPYGAKAWDSNEYCQELDYICVEPQASDTFCQASFKLRNLVDEAKIKYVPQYHTHPDDYMYYLKGQSIWDRNAGWLHVGSLSSGYRNMLDTSKPLTSMPSNDFEMREYERRVQFWQLFHSKRPPGEIDAFANQYAEAIERIITEMGLNRKRIMQRHKIYAEVSEWLTF